MPAGVSEVWRDAHINERASLAQARTQELVEWVMKDQATPPSEAACIVESHDPLADAFVRVRIARNIQGIPFCPGLSAGQKVRLASFITGPRSHLYDFLAQGSLPGVTAWRCYSDDEDHLRVEWIYRSLPSAADVRGLEAAVAAIDGMFAYAMSPELGYLTSCPKNAGGGIKASIRLSGAWQDGALRRQIRRAGVETAKKGHDVVAMMRVAHPNHLASALVQLSSLAT
ncbi:MAG: hypothetical protein HY042_05750, partial [Spirochaetia bacterium]|nr:hypothetical protein [Spirochaetia bacterium]